MNAENASLISEYFGMVIFGIMFDCSSQVTLQFKCFTATWDSPKHLQIYDSKYEVTTVVVSITYKVSLASEHTSINSSRVLDLHWYQEV